MMSLRSVPVYECWAAGSEAIAWSVRGLELPKPTAKIVMPAAFAKSACGIGEPEFCSPSVMRMMIGVPEPVRPASCC